MRHVIDSFELLDSALVTGAAVAHFVRQHGVEDVSTRRVATDLGGTTLLKAVIPGTAGRIRGGSSPTLGVVGRAGGVGVRPDRIGFVSDGDGALAAIATAAKLGCMGQRGDALPGDVVVATHVAPAAPVVPHDPVPFVGTPVPMSVICEFEGDERMEAVLSIDATRANRIVNGRGFAITPTVKEGYILRISPDLLDVVERVTGAPALTCPLAVQDITPYANDLYHVNSIMQPATATTSPVVGVAVTSETVIAGPATGVTDLQAIDSVVRFCVEVAKQYGAHKCQFFDPAEFDRLRSMYGSMRHLQQAPVPEAT